MAFILELWQKWLDLMARKAVYCLKQFYAQPLIPAIQFFRLWLLVTPSHSSQTASRGPARLTVASSKLPPEMPIP